jgi:hypothetical protein
MRLNRLTIAQAQYPATTPAGRQSTHLFADIGSPLYFFGTLAGPASERERLAPCYLFVMDERARAWAGDDTISAAWSLKAGSWKERP